MVIDNILIVGNVSISTKDIKFKVHSRIGDLFDPEKAEEDAKRIAELAGIESCYHSTNIVDNKVELTFVVGERDIVRSIVFVGNRKYKGKTLRKKLGFEIGDRLDELISAESGRLALKQFYLKEGFAFVQVTMDSEQLRKGRLIYTIDEGPRVKIEKVSFSGNNRISTKTLKKAIKTNKKRRFLWPRYYNEGEVAGDVTRLEYIYYERGFLDPNITVEGPHFSKDKRKVDITFVIEEGPRYTIEKIVFIGNERFDDERLRAELKLEPGQIYNKRRALSDAERLRKLYREEGFIDAEVKHLMPRFVEAVNAVDIEFEIAEGQQFRIGRLDITGNKRTQDKVIRRVLDEYDFQPGKWYDADVAPREGGGELEREIQWRVLAEAASIRPRGTPYGYSPDKDVRVTDTEVNIKEGQTGAWNLGGGVSSDSGIIGQVVFEQRNFNIKDWPRNFIELITGRPPSRGAGQSLRIALQPGVELSQYSVSFTEPYFRDKPTALNVIGRSYERELESYDLGRLGAYVRFEQRYQQRYKERWRKSIAFRAENVDVDDVHSNAPTEIQSVKGTNALAGVKFGIRRDLTDDRFNPSTGYSFNAGYEQLGGDYTFGILSGTYRRYKTLYKDLAERKTVLVTKLLAATVIGDAPPFEKFYAGGTGIHGIRGFDYRGVSTRAGVNKDPIGSDWIFLANAEVTVPLVGKEFAALFFVDSGAIDSGNYRVSVGTGIQILIPRWFGAVPMRFEIAAPLMRDDDDDTRVFSFSVGRLF